MSVMKRVPVARLTQAFTLIELIVIITTLALIVVLVLPALNKAKSRAQRITCVSHLKEIGLSLRQWSLDHTNHFPMSHSINFGGTKEYLATDETFRHFQVMSNELSTPRLLVCPGDTRQPAKDFGPGFNNSNISYFINLDTDETAPSMFLCGDSNFELGGVPPKPGLIELHTNSVVTWTKERHGGGGNILLSDGSVQQVTSAGLSMLLQGSGVTNRLAVP